MIEGLTMNRNSFGYRDLLGIGNDRRHGHSGLLECLLKRWRNPANTDIRSVFKMFPARCYRFTTVQSLKHLQEALN